MKAVFLALILNLIAFSSHATVEINCTNGVALKATSLVFAGSNGGFRKGQFVVKVDDNSSGISNMLDQLAGESSCVVTPKLPLEVGCAGGVKFKISMATFTPISFNGGMKVGIMYSISVKTKGLAFSNIYDLLRPSAVSKGSIACMIY